MRQRYAGRKILLVAPNLSQFESWGGWLGLAFQKLGHDLRGFDYRSVAGEVGIHTMNVRLGKAARAFEPDLIVVVKGELVYPKTLAKQWKYSKVCLLANDDHQVYQGVSAPLGRYCHMVFTFTKGALEWYGRDGIRAEFMRFFADPVICAPKDSPKLWDVSFVGTYYPEREPIVKALCQSGLKFRLVGDGWNRSDRAQWLGQTVQRPDYVEVLRTWHSSRICLNIHQDGLKRLDVIANLRCYELAACQCFMLSDYLDGMGETFGNPLPFGTWKEGDDIVDAVQYWADREEEKKQMSDRFRQVVLEKHTPEKRAIQILDRLEIESEKDSLHRLGLLQ